MRHKVSGYKLGRKTGSRKALYRILLNECIKRGKIRTTMSKAKAVQPKLEKLITLGRKGSINDKRKAYSIVKDYSNDMIIASDQILVCENQILSKPKNQEEAIKKLLFLFVVITQKKVLRI